MQKIYFYHSKPEIDPKQKKKRMTICCIVDNNKMCYGFVVLNTKPPKRKNEKGEMEIVGKPDVFTKEFGRQISQARAERKPTLVMEAPETGVKSAFLETCESLIKTYLRPTEHIDWDKANLRNIKTVTRKVKDLLRTRKILIQWAGLNEEDLDDAFKLVFEQKAELKPTA